MLISAGVQAVPSRAQGAPDDPGFEYQWGLTQVGADEAWGVGEGRGATVAVLSTGVHLSHEDLEDNLLGGRDFVNGDSSPQDDHGWGTHLAGIVAAVIDNGKGVAGLAPRAKVLPVKILDRNGRGSEGALISGIRYAIERGVEVMLVDLDGRTILSQSSQFRAALTDAWNAGVVPVIPAEHPHVRSATFSEVPALVATGVTRSGDSGSYTNGVGAAKWGLAAPGGAGARDENDIFSTYWPHTVQDPINGRQEFGRYAFQAGDGQAAGHIAGAAALLRGLGQTPEQTVQRLVTNAGDAGPTGRDATYGHGILHAGRSVRGLPPQGRASGSTSPTSAPAGGARPPAQGGGTASTAPPPPPPTGPPATGASEDGAPTAEPAGPATPADGSVPPVEDVESADVLGSLTAGQEQEPAGRTPVLPLIAFLLLVGSGAITWALRRRTLGPDARPPINS